MNIKEVRNQIVTAARDSPVITSTELIDETNYAVKYHLIIDQLTFVQVYHNVDTDTISYVLVRSLSRIYGRDCFDGIWHKHPFEDPHTHDFSIDGQKHCTIQDFLEEVEEILTEENLL